MPDTLVDLQQYLIDQSVVRDPAVAGSLPPAHLHPQYGTPAPTEGGSAAEVGTTLVIGLFRGSGIPSRRHEGFMKTDTVEIVMRSRDLKVSSDFAEQLRPMLHDKRAWEMNNTPVIESLMLRDFQPLTQGDEGYTANVEYSFETWAPFAPFS